MKGNFRLVPKFSENMMDIVFVLPNGDCRVIARVCLPCDGQHNDDLSCAEEICSALRKRIRRSV
jgi:hypothetical protein